MAKGQLDFSHISTGIFVPVIILFGLVFGYFVGWPQIKSFREAQTQLTQNNAEIYDRETSLTAIKKLIDQVEVDTETLATIDGALPNSTAIPELLANLEYLVIQSGLALSDLDLDIPREVELSVEEQQKRVGENLGLVFADVSVSGQYPQLYAFILNVERNLRLFDVERIEFEKSSADEATQKYNIRLKTYYQKTK